MFLLCIHTFLVGFVSRHSLLVPPFLTGACPLHHSQVPVSINVLDEIVAALFNGSTDAEVEVDVFAAAETEVSTLLSCHRNLHW
jgi:hypothetical protein